MAADAFEEMCCALLSKETSIAFADLFGRAREPQFGIDVLGEIEMDGGIEVVSCKCHGRIKIGELSKWSDDFLNHWDAHWKTRRVRRFVLAIAADVKSSARQKDIISEKARFAAIGVTYEPWPPRVLQEKLRSQPGLVAQFLGKEWVERLCGTTVCSTGDPKRLLEERWTYCQACEFEKAVVCAEEAARLAREAGDKKTLRSALRCSVRDLGNQLTSKRMDEVEANQINSRIGSHIAELEILDMPEAELALEKALFARLERRADDALKYAKAAEMGTDDPETVAETLLVQLHAHWQKGTFEDGLALREQIKSVEARLEKGDSALVLWAGWLRTLCKASKSTDDDLQSFITLVWKLIADNRVSLAMALLLVDEVVSEFGRANDLSGASILLELALELAISGRDPLRIATIAIQIAEVEAEMGDEAGARKNLGVADKWIDTLKSDGDKKGWTHRKATALVTRGRIESRLARKAEPSDYVRSIRHRKAAYDAFDDALKFVEKHDADLVGEVGPFRADLYLRLGEAAGSLGRYTEAANHYRRARSDQILADERFRDIGMRAWKQETDALLFGGRPVEARSLLVEILTTPWVTESMRTDARKNIAWIDEHVVSVTEWFKSDAAADIDRRVVSNGLRLAVAEQMRPLVEWFGEFPARDGAGHAYSELYDIWGRGGFSRIVAAVRADPLNSISVDATCIADIKLWARVFCPLYDTVIVNWKGHLDAGFALVPMPDNLGPPGEFGGQGYIRTSDILKGKYGWHAAMGWGNFLPKEVTEFLATDALPLLRSGRLVLLPAPLVGCTQSAVGWTDNLFVDALLGGVVKTAGTRTGDADAGSRNLLSRSLDLGTVSIPFIDNIPFCELNQVLDDTVQWLAPLRRLLDASLGSSDLRHERWGGLRPYFTDIRDAFRQLEERWTSICTSRSQKAGWRVAGVAGTFTATERREDAPGSDSMTDLLRSVAGGNPEFGPWVPFWCLREAGGQINWTTPFDNRSTPPDNMARLHGFSSSVSQGWLFPGDGGPGIATAFKIDG
jgi:tetratricopeptide (TPR) repeat protein